MTRRDDEYFVDLWPTSARRRPPARRRDAALRDGPSADLHTTHTRRRDRRGRRIFSGPTYWVTKLVFGAVAAGLLVAGFVTDLGFLGFLGLLVLVFTIGNETEGARRSRTRSLPVDLVGSTTPGHRPNRFELPDWRLPTEDEIPPPRTRRASANQTIPLELPDETPPAT